MILELIFLITQCLLSLLISSMALFQLKKEYRKKTEIAKVEAKYTYKQLIIVAIITVLVQILAFFNSQKNQTDLQVRFNNIYKQNLELKSSIEKSQKHITSKIDSTEGQIALQASENALKASREISSSTILLSNFVNGSKLPPVFASVRASKIPKFVLENNDTLKANIDAFYVNYDEVLLCKRRNGRVDRNCYLSHLLPVTWEFILPGKQVPLDLPNYISEKPKSKFFISISLTQTKYIIEIIILKLETGTLLVSSRTLKKYKSKYLVYHTDKSTMKINWDNEFILPYNEIWGDID